MKVKHVLICHDRTTSANRLRDVSQLAFPDVEIHIVDNLSRAYHLTEHHSPDCVIVGYDLAKTGEFDLMASLLSILDVGCLIVSDFKKIGSHLKIGKFPLTDMSVNNEVLISALKEVIQQGTKKHNDSHSSSVGQKFCPNRIVAIGASTGGIDALARVLAHFTPITPPTLIVQHTGASFVPSMIRLLNAATPARVKAGVDGEVLVQGTIYFAPHNDVHLCLAKGVNRRLALIESDPVSGHRPSIDMLFQSIGPHAKHVAAALLTGMGRDGAAGLKSLYQAGSFTIGQDRKTSVVYGMPRVAMEIGAVTSQLPIDEIGPALLQASLEKATT